MKKVIVLYLLFQLFVFVQAKAQTGIGTITPDASAKLEVAATNKGFLPPRVALTAINVASPITSPANGLMVFNTATAGSSPNQVVPGYYYWDASSLKWVSLSTTVGNVQNQAIYRSTSNTNAYGGVISTWNSRFNNIASGDLTVNSNTSFTLSNGIYKLEWALPYQPTNTYNIMVLQENISGTWSTFLNDNAFASLSNGGGSDWGGGTFAADIVDCTSGLRVFRFVNTDAAGRTLYSGATFIITKLNPSITTSTTADNLGNHIATKNIQLNGFYLSNDGGNEGIRIDNSGNVGIGNNAPSQMLDVTGTGKFSTSIINSGSRTYLGKDGSNMHWLSTTDAVAEPYNLGYGIEANAGILSHRWYTAGVERMRLITSGNLGLGVASPTTSLHIQNANTWGTDVSNTSTPSIYVYNTNNSNSTANATLAVRTGGSGGGKPFISYDIAGVSGFSMGINNPNTNQFIINTLWDFNTSSASNNAIIINKTGQSRVIIPNSTGTYVTDWPSGWGGGLQTFDISTSGVYANVYSTRSDRRLKNSIRQLDQTIVNKFLKLNPVAYLWNQNIQRDTSLQYGLIAQEVETVFPEMVFTGSDSAQTKSVNYQALHALSLKAIQLLNEKLELQNQEIEMIKKELLALKKRKKYTNK